MSLEFGTMHLFMVNTCNPCNCLHLKFQFPFETQTPPPPFTKKYIIHTIDVQHNNLQFRFVLGGRIKKRKQEGGNYFFKK